MQRRGFIKGIFALSAVGLINPKFFGHALYAQEAAIEMPAEGLLHDYLSGKEAQNGSSIMQLNIPETPENGAVVPVEVTINHPMTVDNYISNITILATKNKANKAVSFDLTPANGMAYLYINMKLGQTQDVIILAKTNQGKIYKASKTVRIALGGCS